jgi:hypothetical protein
VLRHAELDATDTLVRDTRGRIPRRRYRPGRNTRGRIAVRDNGSTPGDVGIVRRHADTRERTPRRFAAARDSSIAPGDAGLVAGRVNATDIPDRATCGWALRRGPAGSEPAYTSPAVGSAAVIAERHDDSVAPSGAGVVAAHVADAPDHVTC